MRKGISPVIASILLILVVISLAGAFVVFSDRVATTQTEAAEEQSRELTASATTLFSIIDVDGQDVIIRNIGQETLEPGTVFITVGGERVNYTMDSAIPPGETGELALNELWKTGPGRHSLRVQGASSSDSMQIRVEPSDGAVLDLRFNEGSGTRAFDSSGNENNGELGGGNASRAPEWVDGKVENALNFDGEDDYVEAPSIADLSNDGDIITISAWTRLDSTDGWDIIATQFDTDSENGWFFRYTNDDPDLLSFHMARSSTHHTWVTNDGFADLTGFHHVVMSFEMGTPNSVRMFFDGTQVQGSWVNGDGSIIPNSNDEPLTTGAFVSSPNDIRYQSDGTIDEVLVYNRAHTPEELYTMRRA